jgi:polyisoprenoid-binding protein YceI/predicted small secreted protein
LNKHITLLASALLLASVLLTGCGVVQEPQAAGQPISTPTQTAAVLPTATTEPEPIAAEAPVATAEPAATEAPVATAEPQAPAAAIFEIVSAESEARFKINETLRGAPKLVIGATKQVSGQLSVDPANPRATQIAEIVVDASTLKTDENMRNRAINNFILKTGQYQSVKFKPTEITGLPASVEVGQPFSFQMAGDLTITDVTKPVVWEVMVTPESDMRIKGSATTTIQRGDFNLTIPNVPFVANVEDQVVLELDFVAQAGS